MSAAAAARYAALLEPRPALREDDISSAPAPPPKSELQWQAHWFAGDFGSAFVTTSGERIELVQFGTWNHESGPDFCDAAVRFPDRPNAPTRRGAIELDLSREDWERHGHATNPAFDDVVLHLFFGPGVSAAEHHSPPMFFTRNSRHENIPQVQLDPRALETQGALTFPGQLLPPAAKPGRCLGPLRELSAARADELLAAAARHRLERKAARWQRAVATRGFDEALFIALAAALGYKENQLPFTLLAQRVPLRTLRVEESRAPGSAVSLLLGLAGFLEAPEPAGLDDAEHARETRAYLRARWEQWWTRREALARLTLPRAAWRLSGLRPDNHPQRRLAALAATARHWPQVRALAGSGDPTRDVPHVLGELSDPFWNHHATLKSARSPKPRALIGETRAVEMLANIFFPLAVADAARTDSAWTQYARLPAKLSNRRVETAATRLFGGAAAAKPFLKTVVQQQGLLQIYEDFCLRDASDCARCVFPERVERFGMRSGE